MKVTRVSIFGKHITSFNIDRRYEQYVFEVLKRLEKQSGYPKLEVEETNET